MLLLTGHAGFTQPNYQVTYSLRGRQMGEGVLTCSNQRSVYSEGVTAARQSARQVNQQGEVMAEAMKRVDSDVPVALNKKPVLVRNLQTQTVEYAENNTPYQYTVADNTPTTWTLSNECRKLARLPARKRKRLSKAGRIRLSFTKEIPYSTGPWRLAGLPGLILEAESTD